MNKLNPHDIFTERGFRSIELLLKKDQPISVEEY